MKRPGSAFSCVLLLLVMMSVGGVANVSAPMSDPTRPLRAPAAAAAPVSARERPSLDSVLIGPRRRVAVIDGQRMSEGESRSGIKVWEIRPDSVVVSVNDSPRLVLEIGNSRMHKELR